MPKRKLFRIVDTATGTLVCDRAHIADTFRTRLFGLLGTNPLAEGAGLLIRPSSGVHTFAMSFPIDVVALDHNRTVVGLSPAVPPWRIAALGTRTRSVLELPAGQIERNRLTLGSTLSIEPLAPVAPS